METPRELSVLMLPLLPFFSGVIFKTRSGNEAPEELNQAANSHYELGHLNITY